METKYIVAIIFVALAGALYAAVNISPNKFESREPLIKSPIIGLMGLFGAIMSGAAIIGMFCVDIIYGIATIASLLCGYFFSWYIIKRPERKYIKEHLK